MKTLKFLGWFLAYIPPSILLFGWAVVSTPVTARSLWFLLTAPYWIFGVAFNEARDRAFRD